MEAEKEVPKDALEEQEEEEDPKQETAGNAD